MLKDAPKDRVLLLVNQDDVDDTNMTAEEYSTVTHTFTGTISQPGPLIAGVVVAMGFELDEDAMKKDFQRSKKHRKMYCYALLSKLKRHFLNGSSAARRTSSPSSPPDTFQRTKYRRSIRQSRKRRPRSKDDRGSPLFAI